MKLRKYHVYALAAIAACSFTPISASAQSSGSVQSSYSANDAPIYYEKKPRSKNFFHTLFYGEQQRQQQQQRETQEVDRVERSEQVRRTGDNSAIINTELLRVVKTAPSSVAWGQEFNWDYEVTAKHSLAEAVIIDYIPEGAELVSTTPQAEVNGNEIKWVLEDLDDGAVQNLQAVLRPTGEGELASCFTATAIPQACLTTVVGRPELAIAKTGPEQAMVGDSVTYNIVVRNTGTYPATGVVVTDTIPAGLNHESGQRELVYEVGTLEPGANRSIPVTLTVAEKGTFCNVAVATSTNAGEVNAEACTETLNAGVTIAKSGDERQKIGKRANYTVTVTNTGDIDLANVTVVDTAPANTRIIAAPGAQIEENVATWTIGNLRAGSTQEFSVTLTSNTRGTHCNTATVSAPYGLTGSAEACTLWEGMPAILLEVIDTEDGLLVGDPTTYIVRVTNQGSANDTNVVITMDFPEGIQPLSASGATRGTVSGQQVTFEAYPTFAPNQTLEYRVPARAAGEGDNRVNTSLTSDSFVEPILEIESTTVY